ncbi:MAG: DMT family transporter [Alphaproteobacteria bacterium]
MLTRRDLWLGLLVIVLWALNTVVIKVITNELEPFTGLTLRLLFASILFLPFIRLVSREQFWVLFQITLLISVLHWASLVWSISKLEASMAAILLQMQVIFSLFWGWLLFNERFGWRTAVGIVIGIAGIIVLVGMPEEPPPLDAFIGIVFSVIALTLGYARMKSLPAMGGCNYIVYTHILALPALLFMAFAFESPMEIDWGGVNHFNLWFALLFQVCVVSFSNMIWQRLLARNAMSVLPNLTLLIPVLGVIFAVILLGDVITVSMIFGGALTTLGVGIILLRKSQKLKQKIIEPEHYESVTKRHDT